MRLFLKKKTKKQKKNKERTIMSGKYYVIASAEQASHSKPQKIIQAIDTTKSLNWVLKQ